MHEFTQKIKISAEEEEEISLNDSISNLYQLSSGDNKIKNIQKLIKWLLILNKIEPIQEHYGDKLI